MNEFTFSDEFAGVGGFRFAMEAAGGRCVFSSEIDPFARRTYEAFHGEPVHVDDAVRMPSSERPDFDVLVAGFPCPSFSKAGISKRNSSGLPSGFDDGERGKLFFKLADILREKRPLMFLFENVENIVRHDRGETISTICRTVEDAGYSAEWRILNAKGWLPQNRSRFFMMGMRKGGHYDPLRFVREFHDVAPPPSPARLSEVLVEDPGEKYNLSERAWEGLREHRRRHEEKGHGFGYTLIEPPFEGAVTRTMMARYYKDGSEILIWRGDGLTPRRLTPLECFRLQGFPAKVEGWFDGAREQPVSDTQAYKQAGNSIAVPVATSIAMGMARVLRSTT